MPIQIKPYLVESSFMQYTTHLENNIKREKENLFLPYFSVFLLFSQLAKVVLNIPQRFNMISYTIKTPRLILYGIIF